MSTDPRPENSLEPIEGWHCSHLYYRFDRAVLAHLAPHQCEAGRDEFVATLDAAAPHSPARVQVSITAGHKADFGLLLLDPNPLVVDGVHQRLLSGPLGPALVPVWSFVSMTEISEYVPTIEQYARRLEAEGLDPRGDEHRAKLSQYQRRLEIMRKQRLSPDLPAWPATCFYPMNRLRTPEANWFLLDFDERERMMREHGDSGMAFAGKVTQLVTAAVGLDDWEWGVTLWARNPEFLKQIVYRMRFDEASARYAQFGPFYTGYLSTPEDVLRHCRVA